MKVDRQYVRRPDGTRRTALITGAGSGIGRELCRRYHAAGFDLVAASLLGSELACLKEELDAKSSGQHVRVFQVDLAQADAAQAVLDFCDENGIRVDVLVNNAGFGLAGRFVDQPMSRLREMLALNVVTTTALSHAFGGRMRQRGSGMILNVASTIAFQPLPFWAVYAGSKAYVSSFTQALAGELRPFGVHVACLYPGTTATRFLDTAGIHKSVRPWSVGSLIHGAAMDPELVAHCGFGGLLHGGRRIIPGLINKLHFILIKLIPNSVILAVVHGFMKRYRQPNEERR